MNEMVDRVMRELMSSDPDFESYQTIARRLIEAMREPTKPMLDALNGCGGDTDAIWPSMIDAALAEGK